MFIANGNNTGYACLSASAPIFGSSVFMQPCESDNGWTYDENVGTLSIKSHDGKTNLWLGHHRGHYFDKDRDPLVAAAKITKEYINSVGLRKRVTKAKFAKFIHVDPAPLAPPISFI